MLSSFTVGATFEIQDCASAQLERIDALISGSLDGGPPGAGSRMQTALDAVGHSPACTNPRRVSAVISDDGEVNPADALQSEWRGRRR
jgi:hypothetical protein